jgi:4-aminobutyrate aminotransferase-like enzyme
MMRPQRLMRQPRGSGGELRDQVRHQRKVTVSGLDADALTRKNHDVYESPIDAVLSVPPPPVTEVDAVALAAVTFGLAADRAVDVGSERDKAFLLHAGDRPVAVMKVSNVAEHSDVLDMEAAAALHAVSVDVDLPIALPHATADGAYRAAWASEQGIHWVRMYDVLAGTRRADATSLSDAAITAWGTTAARLGRALRGFIHPRAIRTLPWDVQHALQVRPMLTCIADRAVREMVARTLDRFAEMVSPRWPGLRSQVVHGDLTTDNAILDHDGSITGIVDFGDMSHTALLVDVVAVLDSLAARRQGDEMLRVARLVVDGYERVTPLEAGELSMLGELWAARTAVGLAIGSWRAAEALEDAAFAQRYHPHAATMLDHLLTVGWARLAGELGGAHHGGDGASSAALAARRHVFGPATEALSYDEPIHMASAHGTWMIDVHGRRYLDMYNNVPCVGHSHPRVTEAIARQSRTLNTNMRYLHSGAIELAERLVATCPPALDTVFFVNSGSEANDLAWRLATTFTGNSGGLCTSHAYHGLTAAIAPLSPETMPEGATPPSVDTWAPTDTYRNLHTGTGELAAAIERLAARGVAPAMAILDGVLQSDGVHDLPPEQVQALVWLTHQAGGLWVADEVQGGHGRTGEAMWSFERFGIEPDIVTLGKPMGNGHPVGAVITRRDIAERFASGTVFFSTFGGNPVSMAAAHAVLDVLADERVLPRVVEAGEKLRAAAREASEGYGFVGDVRGIGLANAIEIVTDRDSSSPDPVMAERLKNGLRRHGVLVGTTGARGNVLKVRPPLAFTAADVPEFITAFAAALAEHGGTRSQHA